MDIYGVFIELVLVKNPLTGLFPFERQLYTSAFCSKPFFGFGQGGRRLCLTEHVQGLYLYTKCSRGILAQNIASFQDANVTHFTYFILTNLNKKILPKSPQQKSFKSLNKNTWRWTFHRTVSAPIVNETTLLSGRERWPCREGKALNTPTLTFGRLGHLEQVPSSFLSKTIEN